MKKFLVASLIAVTLMASTTSVFAAGSSTTIKTENGSQPIKVYAKHAGGTVTPDVVSVDIEWGSMQFTYASGSTNKWNAQNHTYTVDGASGWSESGNTVKVTNHSNVDIDAEFIYTTDADSGITGSFAYDNKTATAGAVELAKGVENKPTEADNVTATLTLSGTPSNLTSSFAEVGSITVKITKAEA